MLESESFLFTYKSFVRSKEDIELYLDSIVDETNTAEIVSSNGVIQRVIALSLSNTPNISKQGFHINKT